MRTRISMNGNIIPDRMFACTYIGTCFIRIVHVAYMQVKVSHVCFKINFIFSLFLSLSFSSRNFVLKFIGEIAICSSMEVIKLKKITAIYLITLIKSLKNENFDPIIEMSCDNALTILIVDYFVRIYFTSVKFGMSNYTQFESFLIILWIAIASTQYVVNLIKII